jgi:hypothetical protein
MSQLHCRAKDEARLFNPAFCGLILYEAIKGYSSESQTGMPFPSTFLVFPFVLHKCTRERLPSRLLPGNGLASWTVNQPEAKLGFAHRMEVLIPITRESLLWLFRFNAVRIVAKSNFVPVGRRIKSVDPLTDESQEIADCLEAARFVGRWLANAGPPQNAYALMGVRP